MRRKVRALIAIVTVLSLGACGFHLQGRTEYAETLAPIYLQIPDRSTDLVRELSRALEVSRIPVTFAAGDAAATLEILNDLSGREVESVSSRNRPQEYRVFYIADYRVTAGGQVLLGRQRVTRTRIFTYDELEVLAKAHEEQLLRQALAREIAGVISRRLATVEGPAT